jgi:hypothetical protein
MLEKVPGYCYLGKIYILPYSENIIVKFLLVGEMRREREEILGRAWCR